MEWQPIETCPRGVYVFFWDPGFRKIACGERHLEGGLFHDPFNGHYEFLADNYGHDGLEGKITPSHWLPLVPPPKSEG